MHHICITQGPFSPTHQILVCLEQVQQCKLHGLKWCIRDGRKVYFWIDYWVYMLSLVSFVDENNLHYINWDVKVHNFLNQDTKEWNLQVISTFLSSNVLADVKALPILFSPIEDRIFWDFSQNGTFTLKSSTWAIKKPSMHPK